MSLSSDGALTSAPAAPQRAGIPRGGEVKVPLVYQRCRSSLWYDSGVERIFSFLPVLHQILSPSVVSGLRGRELMSGELQTDSMTCATAALCISDVTATCVSLLNIIWGGGLS